MEEREQAVVLRVAPRVGEEEPEVSHRGVARGFGGRRRLARPGVLVWERSEEMGEGSRVNRWAVSSTSFVWVVPVMVGRVPACLSISGLFR